LNIERQFEHYKQFKREGESSSPQLNSYNRFYILADHVIQAGILDQEKSRKNRKIILREEKAKKKDEKCKKSGGRIIERSNCKNWIRKDRYARENYGRGVVKQWSNRVGNEF